MRNIIALLFIATLLGAGALVQSATAQTAPSGVLTPAPVPNRGPDAPAPADRVARPDGSERAAPFSGLPSSVAAGSGQATPSTVGSGENRDGSPAPSLSR